MTELTKFYQAAGWTAFRDWVIDQVMYDGEELNMCLRPDDAQRLEALLEKPWKYQDEIDSWVESKAVPE